MGISDNSNQIYSEIEILVKWVCACGDVHRLDISTAPGWAEYIQDCLCGERYQIKTFDALENYVEVYKLGKREERKSEK